MRKSVCFSPTGSYLRPGGDIRLGVADACELSSFYTFASGDVASDHVAPMSPRAYQLSCVITGQLRLPSFDSVLLNINDSSAGNRQLSKLIKF